MADFIKSWKFMAIIIGLLTLVCGGLVIYGVTTHTEPGLMAETPGFGASDTPIFVCPRSYAPDGTEHAYTLVESAINTTNTRLGLNVLDYAAPGSAGICHITVVVGAPSEHGWRDPGGDAVFTAGSRHCDITTSNTGTDEITLLVLQHELGHCLGLDHDPFESSIMRAVQSPTSGGFPPRITDSDRNLLRHIFEAP